MRKIEATYRKVNYFVTFRTETTGSVVIERAHEIADFTFSIVKMMDGKTSVRLDGSRYDRAVLTDSIEKKIKSLILES